MTPNQADLIQKISKIPDNLMIEKIDVVNDALEVSAHFGDSIDKAVIASLQWFSHQEDFATLTINDMNGINAVFTKEV